MNNSIIPNIIHHIAPEDESKWHPIWKRCRDSFVENFPNHEFNLWNDRDDIDRLVRDHYPEYWVLYSSLPHHIMKIDFVRYCILHKYGGIYADMDYYCYNNFEQFLISDNIFIENTSLLYTSAPYENCLMASCKNSEFMLQVIKNIKYTFIHYRNKLNTKNTYFRTEENDFAVNNITGSGFLTCAIQSFGEYFSIGKFPANLFNQDPIIFRENLIGRHMHSSLWGNEYLDHFSRECLMIIDENFYNTSSEMINQTENFIIKWEDFDFYKDYKESLVE